MPNYCDYTFKVKGTKENCNKFFNKLIDYNEPNHFYRIFEAGIVDQGDDFLELEGYCAWSLNACCRTDGYSGGIDLFAVNTKELDLELEAWSREDEGIFFEEHYIYKKGECIVEEERSIEETPPEWDKDYDPTFDDYIEEFFGDKENCPYTEEDFDEEGNYIIKHDKENGFENWGSFSI